MAPTRCPALPHGWGAAGTLCAGLAVLGDLLSLPCGVAEPCCQTAPVLPAPPHPVICEGQRLLQHSVLLLSNHLSSTWHYLSALLPQAALQGFILPGNGSLASPEQGQGA